MPRVFKIGPYLVYFWSDEMEPLEPVHVHISQGEPEKNSTKVWITKSGRALLCNNNSKIPPHILKNIMDAIEGQYVANNLHFAAAIAFILMLILLVCMAVVKYVTARYVYGGDEE